MQCSLCSYDTEIASNWRRHLKTKRHRQRSGFSCECGALFTTSGNLARHQSTCRKEPDQAIFARLAEEQAERDHIALEQIARIAKEQAEQSAQLAKEQALQLERIAQAQAAQIAALTEKIGALQSVTNVTNNFNLNFFLNETCKDAMTIQQFVKSLPIELIQEEDRRLWKFITHHLEKLPQNVRPIHCTDVKRLSMAVKYQDRDTKEVGWQIDPVKTQSHIMEMGMSTGSRFTEKAKEFKETNVDVDEDEKKQNAWFWTNQFGNDDLEDKPGAFRREVSRVTTIQKEIV